MEDSRKTPGNLETSGGDRPHPLVQVRNLAVRILDTANRLAAGEEIRLLKGVTFQVLRGEVVGVLGESGAGKTTLANALMRQLPPSSYVVEGTIEFEGCSLLSLQERELRKMRGARISMIYQDSAVLNPVLRVGDQLAEVLRAHHGWGRRDYREKAIALLKEVELPEADRIYAAYPHQLSGGQRQRIVIAQALACQPVLVIADEPTASLDPETAWQIVELLDRLRARFQTAFLIISHDLAPLARIADRIVVMYAGRIVEQGSRVEILRRPAHPYTQALLACSLQNDIANIPNMGPQTVGKGSVPTIPGSAPDPKQAALGCDFEGRCPDRMSICCTRFPDEVRQSPTQTVHCFKFGG